MGCMWVGYLSQGPWGLLKGMVCFTLEVKWERLSTMSGYKIVMIYTEFRKKIVIVINTLAI